MGESRERAQTRRRGCDPGAAARADAEGRTVRATTDEAKTGKGNAPGRKKPRRARMTEIRRDAEPTSQRDRGRKPLQRGRAGPAVRTAAAITDGPLMIRDARDSTRDTRRPPHQAPMSKGDGTGYGPGETRTAERHGRSVA